MKLHNKIFFGVLVTLYGTASWSGEITLKNPGFEESADRYIGWSGSQHAGKRAYEMRIDEEVFSEGKRSFRIKQTADQVYGLLRQYVKVPEDAAGKHVQISAMVRTEKVGKKGWGLSISFRSKAGSNISQVRSKFISGDTDWTRVEVKEPIPKGTVKIAISTMLLGGGTAWADDVKMKIVKPEGK